MIFLYFFRYFIIKYERQLETKIQWNLNGIACQMNLSNRSVEYGWLTWVNGNEYCTLHVQMNGRMSLVLSKYIFFSPSNSNLSFGSLMIRLLFQAMLHLKWWIICLTNWTMDSLKESRNLLGFCYEGFFSLARQTERSVETFLILKSLFFFCFNVKTLKSNEKYGQCTTPTKNQIRL